MRGGKATGSLLWSVCRWAAINESSFITRNFTLKHLGVAVFVLVIKHLHAQLPVVLTWNSWSSFFSIQSVTWTRVTSLSPSLGRAFSSMWGGLRKPYLTAKETMTVKNKIVSHKLICILHYWILKKRAYFVYSTESNTFSYFTRWDSLLRKCANLIKITMML